jgi:hypothetical protein
MGLFDRIDDPTFGAGAFAPIQQDVDSGGGDEPEPVGAPEADADAPAGLLDAYGAGPPPEELPPAGGGLRGLLARVTAPDPSGLTFGDKLFAVGSSLKGDSAAAGRYLATRNAALSKQKEAETKRQDAADKVALARQMTGMLAKNMDAKGNIDMKGYLNDLALAGVSPDDKLMATIYPQNIPKPQVANFKDQAIVIDPRHPGDKPLATYNAPPVADPGFDFTGGPGGAEAFRPGGPKDPATVGATAEERAAAAARHRAPRAAPGGVAPLPPGFVRTTKRPGT